MKIPSLHRRALTTAIGGALGIAVMMGLAALAHIPAMSVPFTTSIVLVMAAPDSAQAQPRNILGGHTLSALSGLLVVLAIGHTPWSAPLAVGLSIAAMQWSRTLHPPAGIHGYIIANATIGWTYVLMPVLAGSVVLVAFAYLFHAVAWPRTWPRSWWKEVGAG